MKVYAVIKRIYDDCVDFDNIKIISINTLKTTADDIATLICGDVYNCNIDSFKFPKYRKKDTYLYKVVMFKNGNLYSDHPGRVDFLEYNFIKTYLIAPLEIVNLFAFFVWAKDSKDAIIAAEKIRSKITKKNEWKDVMPKWQKATGSEGR